mmetsp:Transcript_60463/g.121340  ORF Transcript_60463/g.121340 Transcript_60463/m.121340 type:complete len:698 (+) Transcript_60463:54-2147(+)
MSKKGLVKTVGTDGKTAYSFQDRERHDTIQCETDFVAEPEQTAMFAGGPEIKILIASSNVGNAPILEMDSWVPRNAPDTDIVVFGLQESTYGGHTPPSMEGIDAATRKNLEKELGAEQGQRAKEAAVEAEVVLTPENVAAVADDAEEGDGDAHPEAQTSKSKLSGAKHLLTTLQRQVGSDFVLLSAVMRGQMRIRVYIRRSLLSKVSAVESGAENTGLGGVVANKGGQAVKFDLAGTTLVFVNSHLAAHESAAKCNKRDEDAHEIFNSLTFGDRVHDLAQFDHVFWCGDLNYRLEVPGQMPKGKAAELVHELVNREKFAELWKMDELQREVKAGRAFCNFRTAKCNFKPTFKVMKGTSDTVYNEKRIPSYCDRILWKSHAHLEEHVSCHSFEGCHAFATSDHKPVLGRFSVFPTPKPGNLPTAPPFTNGPAGEVPPSSPSTRASTSAAAGNFPFFPQLKFFDLKAMDLTAMDTGVTLQKMPDKTDNAASTSMDDDDENGDDDGDAASVSGVSVAFTSAQVKPGFTAPPKRARGWTIAAAKSDPYVVVDTFPAALKAASAEVKTEVKRQVLNAVWDSAPVLSLRANSWEELREGGVRLTVFDNDVGSEDDVIGVVEFSFEEFASAADDETGVGVGGGGVVAFKRDVVNNGRLQGILTGKIEVNIPGPSGKFVHKSRCVDDTKILNARSGAPRQCCAVS